MDLLNVIFDQPILQAIHVVLDRENQQQIVDMILWNETEEVKNNIRASLFNTMVTTRSGSLVTISSMTMLFRLNAKHRDAFLADMSTSLDEEDRQCLQDFADKFSSFTCDARRIQKALQCDAHTALTIESLYEEMGCDTFAFLQGVMSDTLLFDEEELTEMDEHEIKSAIFSYLDEAFS